MGRCEKRKILVKIGPPRTFTPRSADLKIVGYDQHFCRPRLFLIKKYSGRRKSKKVGAQKKEKFGPIRAKSCNFGPPKLQNLHIFALEMHILAVNFWWRAGRKVQKFAKFATFWKSREFWHFLKTAATVHLHLKSAKMGKKKKEKFLVKIGPASTFTPKIGQNRGREKSWV